MCIYIYIYVYIYIYTHTSQLDQTQFRPPLSVDDGGFAAQPEAAAR